MTIDRRDRFERLTSKSAVMIGLCVLPIYFGMDYVSPSRSLASAIGAFVFFTIVMMHWDVRAKMWFWFAVFVLGLIHVAAIFLFEWSGAQYVWFEMLPLALIDFLVSYGFVRLVEGFVETGNGVNS